MKKETEKVAPSSGDAVMSATMMATVSPPVNICESVRSARGKTSKLEAMSGGSLWTHWHSQWLAKTKLLPSNSGCGTDKTNTSARKTMEERGRLRKAWAGLCHRVAMAAANVISAIEAGHVACRDLRGEHRHDGSKPTQPTQNKGWSLKCRFVVG